MRHHLLVTFFIMNLQIRSFILFVFLFSLFVNAFAQSNQSDLPEIEGLDSLHINYLPEITVVGSGSRNDIQQLPEIVGTSIYAGKKNALVVIGNVQGNIATNTMRQIMAKVPGIHVWESDASGIQVGIAARGLSPNRSWEFNVRQNGYDIAADPFGYPEAYYNPQLQAVQRLEIVRGQGALQYGPQFGGMVNYILRNGSDLKQKIQFETNQTIGNNGLFNSYNAVGGKTEQLHYYAFFDHRNGKGWRENSAYSTNAGFATLTYKPNKRLSLSAELMRWQMQSQQAGGLTDVWFEQDAQQSLRGRNYLGLDWTTAAFILNYKISENSRLNTKFFGVLGNRNSVGFMPSGGIVVKDSINSSTLAYHARTVDTDLYRNMGTETRYIGDYKLGKFNNTISAGVRLYAGYTQRFRGGKGSTGTNYDLSIADGKWNAEIAYKSYNAAIFAEHIFRFSDKFYLIPGIRGEYLSAEASGYNGLDAVGSPIPLQNQQKGRLMVLAGMGMEWHVWAATELYANISQAYRPVQFADLTTPPTTDQIDPNLNDAKGFNADIGYRGKVSENLFFDASIYYLQYNNRVGTLKQQREDGSFYNYRTNVGNSHAKGLEMVVEAKIVRALLERTDWNDFSLFASYSYNDARYGDFKVVVQSGAGLEERNYVNKRVENAPVHLLRTGTTYRVKGFATTVQYSFTSESFADANNTVEVSANGQNGLIPSYGVWDLTLSYELQKRWKFMTGINNLTDTRYFTRRASGYPGPGLLPADGRGWFVSAGLRF